MSDIRKSLKTEFIEGDISEEEKLQYYQNIMEIFKDVFALCDLREPAKFVVALKRLINSLRMDIPFVGFSLPSPDYFWSLEMVLEETDTDVGDLICWALARMAIVWPRTYSEHRINSDFVKKLIECCVEKNWVHAIDFLANFAWKFFMPNETWRDMDPIVQLALKNQSLARGTLILIRNMNQNDSQIVTKMKSMRHCYAEYVGNVVRLLDIVQGDNELLMLFLSTLKSLIKTDPIAAKVCMEIWDNICAVLENPEPDVLTAALDLIYSIIRVRKCKIDVSLFPIDKLLELSKVTDNEFVDVQCLAIETLRLCSGLFPVFFTTHDLLNFAMTNIDSVPYRLHHQLLWLVSVFLVSMDSSILSAVAGETSPVDFAVSVFHFLFDRASSCPEDSFLAVMPLIGLKIRGTPSDDAELMQEILEKCGGEEFIENCQMTDEEMEKWCRLWYQYDSSEIQSIRFTYS